MFLSNKGVWLRYAKVLVGFSVTWLSVLPARARCWLLHGVKLRAIRGEEEVE